MRNMGSRHHVASQARTPVRSAVLITVAPFGQIPSADTRVLVAGFTVAEGSMAEVVFMGAEAEDSYRNFHLQRKEYGR